MQLTLFLQPRAGRELAGEDGVALLALVAGEFTALSRHVCSLGPAQFAADSVGESLLAYLRGLGSALTNTAAGFQQSGLDTLAVHTAGVLTHLLPALGCDGPAHMALAVAQQTDMQLAVVQRRVACSASSQRSSAGLQPPLLSAACLEGLAVALGAMSALVEAETQRLLGLAGDSAAGSAARLVSSCGAAGRLGQVCGTLEAAHKANWGGISIADLAAAAAEAALRLSGRLLQLQRQLAAAAGPPCDEACRELDGMALAATKLGNVLLDSLVMALARLVAQPEQPANLAAGLTACAHLCATAAKLGLLLSGQAAPHQAAAENHLRVVSTASQVVLLPLSGWSDFLLQDPSLHRCSKVGGRGK